MTANQQAPVDRFAEDALLSAYAMSQAGWTEEVEKHWINKRVKLLSKLFSKCAGPSIDTCLKAVTSTAVMDAVEADLKETCKSQPALCKSKVVALLQFCRFAHGRVPDARAELKSAIARVEEWRTKASKEDRKRESKLQGKMSDESYLPGQEELRQFRDNLQTNLEKFFKGERRPNYTNAVELRRILEAKICLMDFNRAGPLTNATITEFENLERFEDGRAVLTVEKHKSTATHGPANLPLSQEIVQGLDLFVSEFRPKLTGNRDGQLFKSAKPHTDLKQLALGQGMIDLSMKLTPTMLRKVASTAARSTLPESQCEQLANLMCHQTETQRRNYAAKQRKSCNMEVAGLMQDQLFGQPEQPEPSAPKSSENKQVPSGRKLFGEEEMDALGRAVDEIKMPLTMKQVMSMQEKYPVLAKRGTKVIYNKLKELHAAQNRTSVWVATGRVRV